MRFYAWRTNFKEAGAMTVENRLLPQFVSRVLAARGITDSAAAEHFVLCDEPLQSPFALQGMETAVELILQAMEEGKKILVFGDYDCDGIMATVLLYDYLENEGADVCYYIPQRISEGYGLSKDTVRMIKESGIDLIITVDNGISSYEEIGYAKELGMQVVVTDHHALPEQLPPADAIVNSAFANDRDPSRYLCGAGVAFKLVAALEQTMQQSDDAQEMMLSQYGDLVAIATLADVVPLVGENRTIARMGLEVLKNTDRPGLHALAEDARIDLYEANSETAVFTIAPRINVTGRIGSVDTAVELLLSNDPIQASQLAAEIGRLNTERRRIEEGIAEEMSEQIRKNPRLLQHRLLGLVGDDWHLGVIGISASRMVERYRKPCLIISCSEGIARGSARSVEGFSIIEAIASCSDLLVKFGGHPMAAGFTLKEENIPAFLNAMEEYAAEHFPIMPVSVLNLDAPLMPGEVSVANIDALMQLSPFGCENPMPAFLLQNVVLQSVTPIGNGNHLRLMVAASGQHISLVYFGMTAAKFPFVAGDRIDVACSLSINVYNEQRQPSVRVLNIHPAAWQQCQVLVDAANFDALMRRDHVGEGFEEFSRQDLAIVFRFLREHTPHTCGADGLFYRLRRSGAEISYFKVLAALQIMYELQLLQQGENEELILINADRKVELEQSATYMILQKGR